MAIDAVIDEITEEGANLRLHLRPRVERDMSDSIAGQTEMVILNYTRKPEIGREIWGGSGMVLIEPLWGNGETWEYERIEYTKLCEKTWEG
jgi:hypothetical protein